MENLKFKTNIKCGGCIASITPSLKELKGLVHWEVDLNSPDKILSVQLEEGVPAKEIISALATKGYKAEQF